MAGRMETLDGLVEPGDQSAQSGVGRRFIPVIEDGIERRLAPDGADHRAKDGGHPQQRHQASAETDAAKRGKDNQNDHSQAKANHHLG